MMHELRAPFWNPRGVMFRVSPTPGIALFTALGRMFGAPRDVVVGDRTLDHMYYVATRSPVPVQGLLRDPKIRQHLVLLPRFRISVRHHKDFPSGLDELHCPFRWPPDNARRLKRIFELVREILRWFAQDGADYSDEVRLNIRRLEGPRGSVLARLGPFDGSVLLWEGDTARAAAARALGESRDARAMLPLLRAIEDPSDAIRLVAIRALGALGDRRALGSLIPLLGARTHDGPGIGGVAAEALRALSAGPLVDAFDEALAGEAGRLKALAGDFRPQVIEALLGSLARTNRRSFAHAYMALAELGAIEALPFMVEKLKSAGLEELRAECQGAIDALGAFLSLPRSADAPVDRSGTLPRVARADPRPSDSLPRPLPPTRRNEA